MMPFPSRPLVIAHRGGHYADLPGEQTVAHFERAVRLGVDFIEVDLRETADGHIVCLHDPDHAGLPVAASRLDALVAASRAAGIPAPALLSELVDIAGGRVGLDLEIKAEGFEERLVRTVAGLDPVIFKCFKDEVVRRLKDLAPGRTVGLLLGVGSPRLGPLTRMTELFPEVRTRRCGADFVSPHHRLVRFGFVARMRRLGLPVLAWTVNEPEIMAWALANVSGVITDQPEACLRMRVGQGHAGAVPEGVRTRG
ncbi:MAG: hypothetical protein AMXMBFR64_26620 [Myxococcales bacterium]